MSKVDRLQELGTNKDDKNEKAKSLYKQVENWEFKYKYY